MSVSTVQLYCPEHEVTMDTSYIPPSATWDMFIAAIKCQPKLEVYNMSNMWSYDINGEALFDDEFPKIASGERILLATSATKRMCAKPALEAVLYLVDTSLPKPCRVRISFLSH